MAASAFSRLCAPSSDHSAAPTGAPSLRDSEARPSPTSRTRPSTRRRPRRALKRSTGVQKPRSSSRSMFASRPFATTSPLPGTVRSSWWNCQLDRVDVREDVGVVVLDIVEHERARPVVHELRALVEERRVVLVRLDDEVLASRRAARRCRNCAARRRSGSRASSPACSRIHASMLAVVVLPCVPATASTHLPAQHVLREPLRPGRSTACPSRAVLRQRACRVTARCRRRRSRASASSVRGVVAFDRARCRAPRAACSSADRRSGRSRRLRGPPPWRAPRCRP